MQNVSITDDQKALLHANSLHFAVDDVVHGVRGDSKEATNEVVPLTHLTQKVVHISTNMWPPKRQGKELRQLVSRSMMHGVEIRSLPDHHFLKGQTGLFASQAFCQFGIVGEYCGLIKTAGFGGEYTAELNSVSLDAQSFGNECRAINHYQNIASDPNVIMQVAYVNELPHLMIVCKRDIEVGEELLLDYGSSYVKQFFGATEDVEAKNDEAVEWGEIAGGF